MSIKVKCIDDSNKPKEIPNNKWVKKDSEYELTFIAWCLPLKCQGFSLAEIELDDTCLPYEYFNAQRFAIKEEDLEAFLQLAKDCTDLNDLNLEELLEETKVNVDYAY